MPTFVYYTPLQDAYIAEYYPDTNFGNIPYLYTNNYQGTYDEYRSLVQFDLCNECNPIPPNSVLDPNFLYLHIYRNEIPDSTTLYAYRIKQAWNEHTVTWNNLPLFDPIPVGQVDIAAGFFGQVQMPLDPAVVQSWYNGYYQNYGLLLKCNETANSLIGFYSREFFDPDLWPRLVVCYYQNCCENPT